MKIQVTLFLMLLVLTGSLAQAQTKNQIRAFKLYKNAKTYMNAGKFDKACNTLDKAYKLYPQPNILFRKASCLEAKDEPQKALNILKKIKHASSVLRTKVKAAINRLTILMRKPVKVTLVTPKAGAIVVIDGAKNCKTPCTLPLTRGLHSFSIKQEGYKPIKLSRDIRGLTGKVINAPMQLIVQKIDIAIQPPDIRAKILVDGAPIPATSRTAAGSWAIGLRTGKHTVAVMADGYETCFKKFNVKKGTQSVVSCYMQKKGSSYWTQNRIIAWSMVEGGTIMTGIGIYLLASYYSDKNIAKNTGWILKSNKQYAGPILIGLGVATAATSTYFFLRDSRHKKGVQSVSLSVSPDGAFVGTLIHF